MTMIWALGLSLIHICIFIETVDATGFVSVLYPIDSNHIRNWIGKLRSAELLLKEDGSVQMIRRAETIKDYYATFDFCDALDTAETV